MKSPVISYGNGYTPAKIMLVIVPNFLINNDDQTSSRVLVSAIIYSILGYAKDNTGLNDLPAWGMRL